MMSRANPQWLLAFDETLSLNDDGECFFNHNSEFDVCLYSDGYTLTGAIQVKIEEEVDAYADYTLSWNHDKAPVHTSLAVDSESGNLILKLVLNLVESQPEKTANILKDYLKTACQLQEEFNAGSLLTAQSDKSLEEEDSLSVGLTFNPLLAV